jgi:L-aminopeptidase/D-esterase-like protein
MRWLESRGRGLSVGLARVPIVPAAVLFDLGVGGLERPDAASGARACDAAVPLDQAAEGNVGAGAGATVGKSLGPERAMRGGLGIASRTAGGLAMAAVVAVNAVGDVVDPESGAILAGARAGTDRAEPLGTLAVMLGESTRGARASGGGSAGAPANLPGPAGRGPNPGRGLAEDPGQGLAEDPGQGLAQDPGQGLAQDPGQGLAQDPGPGLAQDPGQGLANTTIGVLVTDARLTKAQATRLAQVGHDGLARTIRPVHTPMDGDTLFAAGTGTAAAEPADQATMFLLCALAAEVVAEAVVRGVRAAHGWRGDGLWLPAWRDRA